MHTFSMINLRDFWCGSFPTEYLEGEREDSEVGSGGVGVRLVEEVKVGVRE